MIGFLSVSIVLIIWIVSAVSFFGLLEMFFTFFYKYDLDAFVDFFFDCFFAVVFGILGVFFWVFLGLRGPLGVILASFLGPRGPLGHHFGSKSELWGLRGSLLDGWWFQGGSMVKKSLSPPHFGLILGSFSDDVGSILGLFWDHFGVIFG